MRISDWSSDVCSSDLRPKILTGPGTPGGVQPHHFHAIVDQILIERRFILQIHFRSAKRRLVERRLRNEEMPVLDDLRHLRSEEKTSELQSLIRITYAVFCLNKKITLKSCKLIIPHQL